MLRIDQKEGKGEAKRLVKRPLQHSGKRYQWLGSKIDQIMNLILNVEAIRFLDRLDIDMKKKKGRKEEKKRERK